MDQKKSSGNFLFISRRFWILKHYYIAKKFSETLQTSPSFKAGSTDTSISTSLWGSAVNLKRDFLMVDGTGLIKSLNKNETQLFSLKMLES